MKHIKDMTYLEMKQLKNIQMDMLADAHVNKGSEQMNTLKQIDKNKKTFKKYKKSGKCDLEAQNQVAIHNQANGVQCLGTQDIPPAVLVAQAQFSTNQGSMK